MAAAVDFPGSNKVFGAPPGREDVSDLHTFVNGHAIVSAWELTPEELAEVNRTGRVFVSSLSGGVLYPIYVGSESEVRRLVADYGAVWGREAGDRRAKCSNILCAAAATAFPVIYFGPAQEPRRYKLEVPKAACDSCRETFDPATFFSDGARAEMSRMIDQQGLALPDFGRLETEWIGIEDPVFAELADLREARLWFA